MRKKFFAAMITACMLLSLVTVPAFATVDPSTRDTKGYNSAELPKGPDTTTDIWTVTPENAQYTLDGAYGSINGKTIRFSAGTYGDVLVLGRASKFSGSGTSYYSDNWITPADYEDLQDNGVYRYSRTVENVTFTAEEGVVLPGFTASSGHVYGPEGKPAYDYVRETSTESTVNSYYAAVTLKNLTFDGLTFSGGVSINDYLENSLTDGITFTGCTFLGDKTKMAADTGFRGIGMKADTKNFKNVTVTDCTFTDYYQGIYVQGPENWTIQNCSFDNTTHNAIALQSSTSNPVTGTITVKENIIKNAHDRAVRLGSADDASVVLENNVMLSSGDSDGQLIKAEKLTNTTVSLDYNYWDGKTTAVDGSLTQPAVTGIRGGTFAEAIQPAYCAAGFEPVRQADGSYAVKLDGSSIFAGGTGTAADPYQIANATQLAAFRDSVNGGYSYADEYVKLTADVALDGSNWTPIGNGRRSGSGYTGNAFKGTFDGDGKTVSGLKIQATAANGDDAYGLFGVVAGGTVKNMILTGVDIDVTKGECVGGFIGLMVENSAASGLTIGSKNGGDTVSAVRGLGGIVGRMTISGTIENCVNYATVTGSGANVGGIVGAAYYTAADSTMSITNCKNYGTVTCTAGVVGGIAGLSAADVENCENTAAITGNGVDVAGIVAEQQNAGSVTNCVNSGDITNQNAAYGTGGIVGWVRYNGTVENYGRKEIIEITNNSNSGRISGGNDGGGIVGTVYNAAVVTGNNNAAPSISGKTFAAGIVGNLQFTETPVGGIAEHAVTICNNVSTTVLDQITGGCKDLYVYNNGTTATDKISNNSTEWEAKIGEQKYTTLQYAIDSAKDGETITVLRSVELTTSLNLTGATNLTIQGATRDVTISTTGIAGQKVFSGAPSGNFTLKDLTFTKAIVTIAGATGAVTVDGCTFKDTATTQNDKSGVLNVSGSGAGASLAVTGSTFQNLTRDTSAGGAEFVGIYASGTLQSISVQGSQFRNIAGTALSLRGSGTITITGNTFENWAYGSHESEGRAVRADFSGQAAPTFTFKENKLLPGTQTKESYVKVGEISDPAVPSLDVGRNYWNGLDPAVATVGDPPTPILEIEINGQTLTAEDLKTKVTGITSYYKAESMQEQDLSDYVPPVSGGGSSVTTYSVTVESAANGTVTVSPKNASKDATVTITATPNEGYALDTITVTDKDGKNMELTKVSDTKYTFKMPASKVTVKAAFVKIGTLPFTDVAADAWYYDAVVYVYENGMMTGTNDGTTFSPAMNLTRGMMAQVLYNIEKGTAGTAGTFTDVAAGAWYADAVNWAAAKGIVNGYGNGKFGPEDSITREQMAVLLYNYAKFKGYDMTAAADLTAFSDDEQVSGWAEYAMQWAVAEKLIQGSNNALNPLGTASRAEVAQILMNFGTIVEK